MRLSSRSIKGFEERIHMEPANVLGVVGGEKSFDVGAARSIQGGRHGHECRAHEFCDAFGLVDLTGDAPGVVSQDEQHGARARRAWGGAKEVGERKA